MDGMSDDEQAAFKANSQKEAKKIMDNFKEWDFYLGESLSADGMVALLGWREDGVTPYMLFWKHGLVEEKVVSELSVIHVTKFTTCISASLQ